MKKDVRSIINILDLSKEEIELLMDTADEIEKDPESMNEKELMALEKELNKRMRVCAAELNFEEAAVIRDRLIEVRKLIYDTK